MVALPARMRFLEEWQPQGIAPTSFRRNNTLNKYAELLLLRLINFSQLIAVLNRLR